MKTRDYAQETEKRVAFIREILADAGADGIVYGNSGGKDSALVGILCKKACGNTLGLIMPCASTSNYNTDMSDAKILAEKFGIDTRTVDLTQTAEAIMSSLGESNDITDMAKANIKPRLRMTALYAVAQSENRLVAGTGNRSEAYMGYFTKWGDGAHDFNPIGDLTVTEIFEYLRFLKAPESIINKPPSAGLFEGQTDEGEMGVTYAAVDRFIQTGKCTPEDYEVINRYHLISEHKRCAIKVYG